MREETTTPGTFLLERDTQNLIKVRLRGEREVIQPKKEENKNIVKIVFNAKDGKNFTSVKIGENNNDKGDVEKVTHFPEKDNCADKTVTKDCQSQNAETGQEISIKDTTKCNMSELEIEAAYEDMCASYRDEIYPTEKEKEAYKDTTQDEEDEPPMPWFTTAVDCTQGELYSIREEGLYSFVEEDLEEESAKEDNELKEVGPVYSNIFTKKTLQKQAGLGLVQPVDMARLPTEPEPYEALVLFAKPLNEDSVQKWTKQIRSRTIAVNCHDHQGVVWCSALQQNSAVRFCAGH